ncbi:MAG: hypothetical protein RLO01_12670 [Thalassobaculaceae bacterium]
MIGRRALLPLGPSGAGPAGLTVARFVEAAGAVPPLGIIGPEAVREAFDGDLNQLRDLLQSAIKKVLELSGDDDWWPYVHALFDDFIVVEMKDGKLRRYPYSVDGTDVTLGSPIEVRKTFTPVDDMREAVAIGPFLEASTTEGGRYRIRVIQAGPSHNGNFYPDDVLREAVSLFEGVRVFAKSDAEHLAGGGKDVRNLIGALKNAAFVEAAGGGGEIQADLVLIEPEGAIAVKIREAWDRQLTDLFGFSIDARARATQATHGGRRFREARKFLSVASVDLIVEPGAGGAIIKLLEAKGTKIMNREEIIQLLEAKGLLTGQDPDKLTDDQLATMLREAVQEGTPAAGGDPAPVNPLSSNQGGNQGDQVTREDLRMIEARADARATIAASSLPQAAKDRLQRRFRKADRFTEADVSSAIQDEADYLASFSGGGQVAGLGDGVRVQLLEGRFDKVDAMLDAFFDPDHRDHRHARSFRECYVAMTGDTRVSGDLRNCDDALMREALSSGSFGNVLGDSMTRRMIADYRAGSSYDVWRRIASVVPINDFRTQERTRYGGYGDIPEVAENGTYTALTSPTDEKATYAITKRGGTERVTMEMIKNDDVGVIRRIPTNLSRAAKRTLAKFVLDFFVDNPVIYDGTALFHASHGNLGATALGKASLAAGRLAMLKQTERDSNDRLGIGPRDLWVSPDLEETAVDLFRRNTEQDRNFIQTLSLTVIPVWYWTDVNDWMISADPMDIPTIEVGFLDGNEEPEMFVQDNPTNGSVFTNDQITYKLRHIYGGSVTDFRGVFKGVVV